MGRGLGEVQRRILETLRGEELKWVALNVLIIKRYHPEQLDKKKAEERGFFDWSYSEVERKAVWRSVKALERRGLVSTRIRRIDEERIGNIWGGLRWWMEVKVLNAS